MEELQTKVLEHLKLENGLPKTIIVTDMDRTVTITIKDGKASYLSSETNQIELHID